ncbi:MAG TPA: glycosyltransferase [Acetobacteraceae bacterium]
MRLVFLGLSLSSSWGNGHATTYRALLRALDRRGHEVLFLERDQPWYAAHRDLPKPDFCDLRLYGRVADLDRYAGSIASADAVIVGSYVPEGVAVIDRLSSPVRLFAFYDIDTPITMAGLAEGGTAYLSPAQVPLFDLYLSFTGGPRLRTLERKYGARRARPLYCAVDVELHRPTPSPRRWDLGYIGTYSEDRQPILERLLIEPARQLPERRFAVAGPLYPDGIRWPANVDRIEHLGPADHPGFYCSLGWTLNVTRADMRLAGYSPSVRLFEASACACPILSDPWPGLNTFFLPGRDILVAPDTDDVLAALAMDPASRLAIGAAGRARTLARHTADIRAQELECFLAEARHRDMRRSVAMVAGADA